ncbi:MAG TPA: hypothetical protein VHW96_19400 [Solirubrobacteraceae bacterium]|nr:hypothetical protein [Solirubrobacteraceae bacterium]
MRLGRKPPTAEVDPEFAQLIAGLHYAVEENLERCARLTRLYHDGANASELHEEALAGARRIAYVERVVFEAMAHVIDIRSLPPGMLPMGVHSALARLAYALAALAEEDPEPEALLSQDDIHGLAHQYEIEEWVTRNREQNPDLKGGR